MINPLCLIQTYLPTYLPSSNAHALGLSARQKC